MSVHDIGPGRDRALGDAIRAAWDDGGDAAFAARVRAALARDARPGTWDVLARWLPSGMAAAAALLVGLMATWAATRPAERDVPLAEQLLAAEGVPSGDVVLAGLLEGR